MYADVVREDEMEDGKRTVAFSSRKFTNEVLGYLFQQIGIEAEA